MSSEEPAIVSKKRFYRAEKRQAYLLSTVMRLAGVKHHYLPIKETLRSVVDRLRPWII